MHVRYVLWLILIMFFWSFNPICLKILVPKIGSSWLGFLRFAPLSIVAFFLSRREFKKQNIYFKKLFSREKIVAMFLAGMLLFLQVFLFHFGSTKTSSNYLALIAFSFPLYVPLFSGLWFKTEKFKIRKIFGTIVSFIGIYVMFYTSETSFLVGNVIELVSALLIGFFMAYTKYLIQKFNGLKWTVLAGQMIIASVFFLFAALIENFTVDLNFSIFTLGILFFQIVVISILCWMSFQFLLSKNEASFVTSFYFLPPLFAQIVNYFFGEPILFRMLLSGLLISIGIILVSLDKRILFIKKMIWL